MSSKWNYGLAFFAIPFIVLDLYLHWTLMAILWIVSAFVQLQVGLAKDRINADRRH